MGVEENLKSKQAELPSGNKEDASAQIDSLLSNRRQLCSANIYIRTEIMLKQKYTCKCESFQILCTHIIEK